MKNTVLDDAEIIRERISFLQSQQAGLQSELDGAKAAVDLALESEQFAWAIDLEARAVAAEHLLERTSAELTPLQEKLPVVVGEAERHAIMKKAIPLSAKLAILQAETKRLLAVLDETNLSFVMYARGKLVSIAFQASHDDKVATTTDALRAQISAWAELEVRFDPMAKTLLETAKPEQIKQEFRTEGSDLAPLRERIRPAGNALAQPWKPHIGHSLTRPVIEGILSEFRSDPA
jgi:hypothetical protein